MSSTAQPSTTDQQPTSELQVWAKKLSEHAKNVDRERSEIFEQLKPIFKEISRNLLPEGKVSVTYSRGWPEDQELEQTLNDLLPQERKFKSTRAGAHRAELKLTLDEQDAAATASRGQQKLIAASLLLAQIQHVQHHNSQKCVVLLDDIRAELDGEHAHALLTALQRLGCQVFITAIDQEQIALEGWHDTRTFHVKQGSCKPMS